MMLPQQWEGIIEERRRDWEKEVQHQKLLAQVPAMPARWQRWTGSAMVWTGRWLLCLGERLARRECPECVSVAS